MAKNPNGKSSPAKRSESLNGAMIFFLIGCVAEAYLFMVRRFFINGTIDEILAWNDYLKYFAWIGAAVLIVGAVWVFLWKKQGKKLTAPWCVAGVGAFLAFSGVFMRHFAETGAIFLSVVLPVVMVLALLWSFYDRECSVSLTLMSISVIVIWVCRRKLPDVSMGTFVMIGALVYVALLGGIAWLAKKDKLTALLPATADTLPVYAACGLSAVGVLSALVSTTVAYYAIWCLAVVIFAVAVYYTVKML